MQNGWAPAPFAHQPSHVRQAIRAARMRPKIKCCYENSIRILFQQELVPFTYCEGWVTTAHVPFPIDHAWLKDAAGNVVDLTIGPERKLKILAHQEHDREKVRAATLQSRVFGQVDQAWFLQTHAEMWMQMHGDLQGQFDRLKHLLNPVTHTEEGVSP